MPIRPEDVGSPDSSDSKAKQLLSLLPGMSSGPTCCGEEMEPTHTFAPRQLQRVPSYECRECSRAVHRED